MTNKQNIQNAGEFYTAAYLSAHDFIVTITFGTAKFIDLLVHTPSGHNRSVSVKCTSKPNEKTIMIANTHQQAHDLPEDLDSIIAIVRIKDPSNLKELDIWFFPANLFKEKLFEFKKHFTNLPIIKGPNKGNPHSSKDETYVFPIEVDNRTPPGWDKFLQDHHFNIDVVD